MAEQTPLLPPSSSPRRFHRHAHNRPKLLVILGLFALLTIGSLVLIFTGSMPGVDKPFDSGPEDPLERANWLLSKTETPIIDGHIDLPELTRVVYGNNLSAFDLEKQMIAHVDIPRLKKGKVGGFFWSCYTDCPPEPKGGWSASNFLEPTNAVRDTLEQIDVAKLLIDKYDAFQFAKSSEDIRDAVSKGKIASLLGIEGAHQLGNSLATLRMYAELGVRYVTLTHSCPNAFADSAGIFKSPSPVHHGLSYLGRALIREMNRLGVLVDLSHVSDETAEQALQLTKAPIIWSHSSSRKFVDIQRDVPDWLLKKYVGTKEGQTDGVININFAPYFIAPNKGANASVSTVADHVEHIANITSRKHVGLGSDFDGIEAVPRGLEDVSKYPNLFAELISRGWSDDELEGLAGGNLLRVMEGAERVKREIEEEGKEGPGMERWLARKDIGQGWPF